jgi:FkbM family methyltransferase
MDTSQNGESTYLKSLFPENYIGTCIEVGAYNGISSSNTYLFEQIGWTCMCIEPNPPQFLECKKNRKLVLQYAASFENTDNVDFSVYTLSGNNQSAITGLSTDVRLVESHKKLFNNLKTIKVSCRTLTNLLDEYNFPEEIDIVSIDTENTELDVLKGIDFNKYKIKVFVIENNYDEPYCEEYLTSYGYKKIKKISVNEFYIRQDFLYDSFHGEIENGKYIDEVLKEYFPNSLYKGVFLDIGFFDKNKSSNSYHFEKIGWDVYCLEANSKNIPLLKDTRKNVLNYHINTIEEKPKNNILTNTLMAGMSAIEMTNEYQQMFSWNSYPVKKIHEFEKTLNEIIEKEIPKIEKIDIISVDIEDIELKCLEGLDLIKYKPNIIIIKNLSKSKDIMDYLQNNNYILDKCLSCNEYYISKDFIF